MTPYGASLVIGGLLTVAAVLAVMAFHTPQSRPPDPAAWRARLPKRPRHYAPARIRVVERTDPNLRLAQVNALNAVDRPGRHAAEWIEQPTCVLPDFPRLIREGKL